MSELSVTQTEAPAPHAKPRSAKGWLQTAAFFLWWIPSLFVAAGRLDWVRGWISVALSLAGMTVVGLIVQHYNAPLSQERAKWRRKDTKPFDKVFLAV